MRLLLRQDHSYLMFLSCSSFAEQGISFIQKNCGRGIVSSQLKGFCREKVLASFVHLEKNPNQLFTVPSPLAGKRRATHVEERRLESRRHCLYKNPIDNEKELSPALTFASMVLPVPGGPKSRRLLTEFENIRVCRSEAKMLGKLRGRVTQSCSDCFA